MAYNQQFFLGLAAEGKDAWNAWRRDPANKDMRVTFAGVDFSEAPRDEIDFSGFEFGNDADFSRCKWRDVDATEIQYDSKAFALGRAFFTGATFGDDAKFTGATFGNEANFSGATFGDKANFTAAAFGNCAPGAAFDDTALFAGAAFGAFASFAGAGFRHYASFDGAAFGDYASFEGTFFQVGVEFTGMSEEQWAKDVASKLRMDEKVRAAFERRHKDSWETSDRFLTISFSRARFDGVAVFSGRSFKKTANFTDAHFYTPPDFEWCDGTARLDFTGAHIGFVAPGKLHWTSETEVPVRLRAFRKIAEETKNHDLERDLYIEERKAERGVYWRLLLDELKKAPEELKKKLEDIDEQGAVWSNSLRKARARNAHWLGIAVKIARLFQRLLWILVMGVYWALSDYGRSFVRPAAWLIASGFFFYWRYSEVLAQLLAKSPAMEKYKQAVKMLALGNAVPFVGPLTIDPKIKEFLFCAGEIADKCTPIPPDGFQLWVISQNLLAIILVFFIGLALRNYFRIK